MEIARTLEMAHHSHTPGSFIAILYIHVRTINTQLAHLYSGETTSLTGESGISMTSSAEQALPLTPSSSESMIIGKDTVNIHAPRKTREGTTNRRVKYMASRRVGQWRR